MCSPDVLSALRDTGCCQSCLECVPSSLCVGREACSLVDVMLVRLVAVVIVRLVDVMCARGLVGVRMLRTYCELTSDVIRLNECLIE